MAEVEAKYEIAKSADELQRRWVNETDPDPHGDSTWGKREVMPAIAALDDYERDLRPRLGRWRGKTETVLGALFYPPEPALNLFRDNFSIGDRNRFNALQRDLSRLDGQSDQLTDWYENMDAYVALSETEVVPDVMADGDYGPFVWIKKRGLMFWIAAGAALCEFVVAYSTIAKWINDTFALVMSFLRDWFH